MGQLYKQGFSLKMHTQQKEQLSQMHTTQKEIVKTTVKQAMVIFVFYIKLSTARGNIAHIMKGDPALFLFFFPERSDLSSAYNEEKTPVTLK